MRRIIPALFLTFFLSAPPCQAQAEIKRLVSLDLSYSLTGLLNHGWGIGLGYEEKLLDYLSVKGTLGHMTFLTGIKDVYCTSVNISLFANYYPLGNGLNKLYVSVGSGSDFMNYFGRGELPAGDKDSLVSITPKTGWKFLLSSFVMIDVSAGYKFIIINSENYTAAGDYVNAGLQFDVGFRLLIGLVRQPGWLSHKSCGFSG